jgi:hypothetical protein
MVIILCLLSSAVMEVLTVDPLLGEYRIPILVVLGIREDIMVYRYGGSRFPMPDDFCQTSNSPLNCRLASTSQLLVPPSSVPLFRGGGLGHRSLSDLRPLRVRQLVRGATGLDRSRGSFTIHHSASPEGRRTGIFLLCMHACWPNVFD